MIGAEVGTADGGGGHLSSLGRELSSSPPSDGVSNLRFSNYTDHLLVASWDCKVRLYDGRENALKGQFEHAGPVLDCCFHDDHSAFSAGADTTVKRCDFNTGKEDCLGSHGAPVRCVEYSHATGQVITGSWDKTLKIWDPRMENGHKGSLVDTYDQPERVYSMSLVGQRLVVATAGRHINVYDLRNMAEPEQRRESSLKYQTRCVRCYPNGTGFALSSIEGRVAMEFFDMSEAGQAKKYAFKCHRKLEASQDIVYPVNAMAFHPIYGTFATGGCDGYVNIWDGINKKRLYQYSKYPTSIAALSFSRNGKLLAIASSYTFEEGPKSTPTTHPWKKMRSVSIRVELENESYSVEQFTRVLDACEIVGKFLNLPVWLRPDRDAIFIRSINEAEVKPKPRGNATPS